MSNYKLVTIDRVLNKVNRDLGSIDDIQQSDIVEWIGEALEYLKSPGILERRVGFLSVSRYLARLPQHFVHLIQIGRDNAWTPKQKKKCTPKEVFEEVKEYCISCGDSNENIPIDSYGRLIFPEDDAKIDYIRPDYSIAGSNIDWSKHTSFLAFTGTESNHPGKARYTPIRLSTHTLFENIVCEDKSLGIRCSDEYKIVGTTERFIRTSFKEGRIIMAYYKMSIDEATGYPLIPDHVLCLQFMTYYLQEKICSRWSFQGREGYTVMAREMRDLWDKTLGQALSDATMPQTNDDLENLMRMSNRMLPVDDEYDNFFKYLNVE